MWFYSGFLFGAVIGLLSREWASVIEIPIAYAVFTAIREAHRAAKLRKRSRQTGGSQAEADVRHPDWTISHTNVDLQSRGMSPLSPWEVLLYEFIISVGVCLLGSVGTFGLKQIFT